MSFQLQMEQMSGYLAARFTGVGVMGEMSQQFKSIAEHCRLTNNDKLLIDGTGAEIKITFTSRYIAAKRLSIFSRYGIKVVLVGRPKQFDLGKFARLVAQHRGLTTEPFTDFQAAEEWLLT